jgi:hypothetical protein
MVIQVLIELFLLALEVGEVDLVGWELLPHVVMSTLWEGLGVLGEKEEVEGVLLC